MLCVELNDKNSKYRDTGNNKWHLSGQTHTISKYKEKEKKTMLLIMKIFPSLYTIGVALRRKKQGLGILVQQNQLKSTIVP